MLSFKGRLVLFILKNRHLLQGRLKKRKSVGFNTSIEEIRGDASKSSGLFGKLPEEIVIESVETENLKAEKLSLNNANEKQIILYFHGGGYVMGSIEEHRAIVSKVVMQSQTNALLFNYRLAPENPFPAALNDALLAYDWLLMRGYEPQNIVFMGDSAGGGLCLASLLAIKDQGKAMPAAAVVLSPWTDLTCSGDSFSRNAKVEALAPAESWTVYSKYYAGEADPSMPWISPLFGTLQGLPPILIYVGGHETMLDDSTRFADKAQQAGVDVELHIGEKLFHCYPLTAPLFPEAVQALERIGEFIRERLKK